MKPRLMKQEFIIILKRDTFFSYCLLIGFVVIPIYVDLGEFDVIPRKLSE